MSGFTDTGRLWRIADIAGGQVCFDRTGILVTFVAERFAAGDSIEELAKDYHLSQQDIEAGLRLVIRGASGRFGIRQPVERRMESEIPLLPARNSSSLRPKDGQ